MSEQARLTDQSNLITLLSDFTDDEPDTRVFHASLFPLLDGWQLGGRWVLHPGMECLESPNIFSEEVSLHVSFLNSRAKRHFTQFERYFGIL